MTAPTRTVERGPHAGVRRSSTDRTMDPAEPPATVEPELSNALVVVAADLRARYPDAPPGLVRRCIDDALDRFRDARVRHFLPILIERRASDALREHVRPQPDAEEP